MLIDALNLHVVYIHVIQYQIELNKKVLEWNMDVFDIYFFLIIKDAAFTGYVSSSQSAMYMFQYK